MPFGLGGGGGGGGELAKEVTFIYVFVTILSKPILYVQWLAGFPFYGAVILYSLLFQFKLHLFFLWFCQTCKLEN